jgi:hypothetical protein
VLYSMSVEKNLGHSLLCYSCGDKREAHPVSRWRRVDWTSEIFECPVFIDPVLHRPKSRVEKSLKNLLFHREWIEEFLVNNPAFNYPKFLREEKEKEIELSRELGRAIRGGR